VFWNCHDPTQINRQGPDRGEQYRSVIFYHNSEQEKAARASKQKLQISGKYDKDIATEIKPAGEFYMAEDYHQQYIEKKRLSSKVIS
ncbi:peptide-methionine (S)-S-oxide reductase MsrA, partial [Microcoleus sp. HI-ES]|nr:peptide-methionine (S)-S-oxide reductase MsrA [Microcoleus sp. HI-ES]